MGAPRDCECILKRKLHNVLTSLERDYRHSSEYLLQSKQKSPDAQYAIKIFTLHGVFGRGYSVMLSGKRRKTLFPSGK